ncbi:reverse transcriptase domain-containing protein [Tanacetum coccineum]
MADNRTMAQMLQAPIEGYEDAIVVPPINANNFELKQPLINLVQSNKFTKFRTQRLSFVAFPSFSLDGEARDWLDKEPPRSILTWDDLVSKFINQYFPPSKTTYYRNEIITFYQKPNEAFNEAWERFKGLLRQCPHHGFSELHQLDTFYNSLNSNDQDALDSAAGGNFLDKMPQEGLAIIESKSKVRYSRSRANDSRVSTDAPLSNSSSSNNSFDMQQIAASLEDKMTIKMNQMMSQMKALVVTPAPVKAVEEVCVTCGSNHNFNHCPLTRGGNDFPVFQDNIQQFQQTAAVGNFLQRNQPSNLASQMRPPGFNQPNVQTNQNRYQGTNSNFNQNRGGNFNQNRQNNQNQVYQAPPYQTPTNQPPINQVLPYQPPTNSVLKTDFENYVKANDAVLKNVQNQGQNLQNQMANVTSLLTSLCDNFKNSASTSNSGTLPSQTVTNPRQQINAITTRSGKALEEPSIPLVPSPDVSKPQKEPEQNPETRRKMAKIQNWKIPHMSHLRGKKIPFSLKSQNQKQKKPLIGLKDALVEMPKFNKWLSSLLRNKEKLEEIAITTVNAECSAIIMNKVPEKLEDPGKFLIPCALQELDRTISSPVKTSDNIEKFTDELAPLDSLPSGNDDSTLKKEFHEVNFQVYSNPLFEFDESFRSSNVNPLFEENNKDVEIKSSSSSTLTSPEASELEDYLEKDSIPPGIDLTLPTTLEVLSSNPTFPTLTKEKVCAWETPMFFSLVRFVWKMMTRIAIRKKIMCILATYLHKKPKPLSQEVEEIKENEKEVSSIVPIDTIVMPIRITFDNPIDFNDHFSKLKDLKKDLTVALDSTESSILPPPLLDSDSPFTAELSASITLNSLGNEDKVFKPGILVYHAIHDKNLVTLEKNLKENISSGTLLFFKESYFLLPPPEPPNECLNFEPNLVMKNVMLNEDFYQSKKMLPLNVEDVNSFTFIIWTFLPYFTYPEDSPLIFSFRRLTQQFLKTLVSDVVSRITRASYPLFEISLGRSDILSS